MRSSFRFVPWTAACLLAACAPEGPSGFVTYNIAPDSECTYSPESESLFIPQGLYDISSGISDDYCDAPYIMHLLVNGFLRPNADINQGRAEPNVLQLHSAEVRLMDISRATLLFDRADPPLPNPFLVTTSNVLFPTTSSSPSMAIAAVEVIPTAYAPFLADHTQILAEVQIFGTTTGDVDVDLKPFVYTIQICDGCLTYCRGDFGDEASMEDIYGEDVCIDNSGSDGRRCIDFGC